MDMTSAQSIRWSVTPAKVDDAVRRIVESCHPHAILLFGSYARGEADAGSDLDLLVIADDNTPHCREESVRLRRLLRGISMAMDIIVVRNSDYERLKNTPGLIYETCAKEGIVAYVRS